MTRQDKINHFIRLVAAQKPKSHAYHCFLGRLYTLRHEELKSETRRLRRDNRKGKAA